MSNSAQGSAGGRIKALLDGNSFVEIGSGVTARSTDFNMAPDKTPADGVVTGYGTIDGNLVYVYSQDASVLGGSVGEMHAKKITHVYNLAMKVGAPVIGLVDCAGLRLQEATDALNAFGELYLAQAMASGVIPQITAVFGICGGGMAVASALTDFTFVEENSGKLFVNSPNAIDGNEISKCDTSAVKFQSEEAGMVDFAGDEASVIEQIRTLAAILPANNEDDLSYDECTDDLNRVCADLGDCSGDTALALSMISDNYFFMEMKANYAPEMVTAFIRLNGMTVGCVANRTEQYGEDGELKETYPAVLTADGCDKAARSVNFCDAFAIPILTLTQVKGYDTSLCAERRIARAAARLTYAFANANVAKVNVLVGEVCGTAGVAMNSKSIGADMVYAWPTASVGMMDSVSAARIMYADELTAAKDPAALLNEKAAEYASLQSSVLSAARRGYVDDIIEAQDTRKRVIAAFEMLFTKREDRPGKKHGTI